MRTRTLLITIASLSVWGAACGGDDGVTPQDGSTADQSNAASSDAGPVKNTLDSGGSSDLDASFAIDAATDGGYVADAGDARVERGKYLTTAIFPCGSCHTSRTDPSKTFAGVDCWIDTAPSDADAGCLSSRNLTNDPSGIGMLTDQQVKDLFTKGMRPDGKALFSQMPYANLGNMKDEDADAIVAYLRSLPPIMHAVKNQPPFDVAPSTPEERWPEEDIPQPTANYPARDSALRGRYLAGEIGNCIDCHTPRDPMMKSIRAKAFQGGRAFGNSGGAPVYAANLTPDATGLGAWTADQVAALLKQGTIADHVNASICGPMPVGPKGAYGLITDADALDIGNYLLSLTPAQNAIPGDCWVLSDGGVVNTAVKDGGT